MPSGKEAPSGPLARATSAEIRAEMSRRRISGTRLAAAAGLSQSYMSHRLRDQAPFTLNDIEAICEALGHDVLPFCATVLQQMVDAQNAEKAPTER